MLLHSLVVRVAAVLLRRQSVYPAASFSTLTIASSFAVQEFDKPVAEPLRSFALRVGMLASGAQDLEEGRSQPLVTTVHYRYRCRAYSNSSVWCRTIRRCRGRSRMTAGSITD